MPRALTSVYWDACVFLAYLNKAPEHIDTIETLLAEADAGKTTQIFTSALSIAEVAYGALELTNGTLAPDVEELIAALWLPPRVIVVEVSQHVGTLARNEIRDSLGRNLANQANNPVLKGADACHLATAVYIKAARFLTYDPKVLKQNGHFAFPIEEPAVLQRRLF